MGIVDKCRWIFTFSSFLVLRKALAYRLNDHNEISGGKLPGRVRMVNRVDFIIDYCSGKSVLHVGFADHPYTAEKIENKSLLHLDLKKSAKQVVGFDNNKEAIKKYTDLTGDEHVILGDLMSGPAIIAPAILLDIVLLGEVLEHLKNPHEAVQNLYHSFPAQTVFLITVPNYTSLDAIAGSTAQQEHVHPDHYWYLSTYTLLKMFPPAQFELQELLFGMYFQKGKRINAFLRRFPFMGDCIIGIFKSKKEA